MAPQDERRPPRSTFVAPRDARRTPRSTFVTPQDQRRTRRSTFAAPKDERRTPRSTFVLPQDQRRTRRSTFGAPLPVLRSWRPKMNERRTPRDTGAEPTKQTDDEQCLPLCPRSCLRQCGEALLTLTFASALGALSSPLKAWRALAGVELYPFSVRRPCCYCSGACARPQNSAIP